MGEVDPILYSLYGAEDEAGIGSSLFQLGSGEGVFFYNANNPFYYIIDISEVPFHIAIVV